MNLKNRSVIGALGLAASLCGGVFESGAQEQHYPAGAEGIKGASLPPAGIYARDYNLFYISQQPDVGPLSSIFAYINAPRLIWITDWKILGADYGMDIIVPFGYKEVVWKGVGEVGEPAPRNGEYRFGLADIQIEPLLLSWHLQQFDFAFGYAIWAPTGDFDKTHLANMGNGYWSHMLTGGGTWFFDTNKTWALSVLNRYEMHHDEQHDNSEFGDVLTMEWGLSKTVAKGVDVGFVGYWRQQVSEHRHTGNDGPLSHAVAVGPEITAFVPQLGVAVSARYLRDIDNRYIPEGNTVTLTVTKRF